jgi:hypothetical protein
VQCQRKILNTHGEKEPSSPEFNFFNNIITTKYTSKGGKFLLSGWEETDTEYI